MTSIFNELEWLAIYETGNKSYHQLATECIETIVEMRELVTELESLLEEITPTLAAMEQWRFDI